MGENVSLSFKDLYLCLHGYSSSNGSTLVLDHAYLENWGATWANGTGVTIDIKNTSVWRQSSEHLHSAGYGFHLILDDSVIWGAGGGVINLAYDHNYSGGSYLIDIYGTHPYIECGNHLLHCATSGHNSNGLTMDLVFHVPAGGYTREPVHCYNDGGWDFSTGQARLLVEVANDSPARVTGADCPLIVCSAPNHFKDSLVELGAWTAYDTEDIAEATQIRAVIPRGGTVIFIR